MLVELWLVSRCSLGEHYVMFAERTTTNNVMFRGANNYDGEHNVSLCPEVWSTNLRGRKHLIAENHND
jgi:hypothetical protein